MARMQGSVNLAKNLTIKSLPGVKTDIKEGDLPRMLVHVVGNVTGSEVKQSAFGDNTRFIGMFEIIDIETGESARGSSMYLPGHAETVLADAFSSAGGRPIQFALAVGIKFRLIAGKPGSEYIVQEIGGITEYDPLAGVKAQFGIANKAEAPALEVKAEPVAETPPMPLEGDSKIEGAQQEKIDAEAAAEVKAEAATSSQKGGKKGK